LTGFSAMILSRNEPPEDAIIALGQYITEWGHLEGLIDKLFEYLPPHAGDRANFAFHRLSIQLKTECLLDLLKATTGAPAIEDSLLLQFSDLVERSQSQIKHRNRIIPSVWGNLSSMREPNWCRIYYHSVLEPYGRFTSTKPSDQKFRNTNIYSVDRISRLCSETRQLSDELANPLSQLVNAAPGFWKP
jgi:hypothetical protein